MSRPIPGKGEQSDGGRGGRPWWREPGPLGSGGPSGSGGGAGRGNERREEAVRTRVPTSSRTRPHTPHGGTAPLEPAPLPAPTSPLQGLPRFPQVPGLRAGLAAGLGPELKPTEAWMRSLGRKVRVQTHDQRPAGVALGEVPPFAGTRASRPGRPLTVLLCSARLAHCLTTDPLTSEARPAPSPRLSPGPGPGSAASVSPPTLRPSQEPDPRAPAAAPRSGEMPRCSELSPQPLGPGPRAVLSGLWSAGEWWPGV